MRVPESERMTMFHDPRTDGLGGLCSELYFQPHIVPDLPIRVADRGKYDKIAPHYDEEINGGGLRFVNGIKICGDNQTTFDELHEISKSQTLV